jgi:hypothetical protein
VITEWLIARWADLMVWLAGLVDVPDPPGFVGDLAGYAQQVAAFTADTGVWIPWVLLGVVLAAYAVVVVAGAAIKLVRIVISLFTAGGGSAA